MTEKDATTQGPHQSQTVLTTSKRIENAMAALVTIHGRRANAESILSLADELAQPDFAYLAPQAADKT